MANLPARMKATKSLTYRTRRLLADGNFEATSRLNPGDIFEVAKPRDIRVLKATRKAEELRPEAVVPAPPPRLATKIAAAFPPANVQPANTAPPSDPAADDLKAARAEYEAALDKKPFHGWDAATLRAKIAEAKASDSK